MPEKHLFEYAVVRIIPRVEREEFLNVGVILFCSKQRFLKTIFHLDENRLMALCPLFDISAISENLHAFEKISNGEAKASPIGKLDQASRFRWLTATRSTVLQTSKVHPGFTLDALQTLERLFAQLVL